MNPPRLLLQRDGTGRLRFLLVFLVLKVQDWYRSSHRSNELLHRGFLKVKKCRSESTIKAALLTSRQLMIVKVQWKQRQWKLYICFKPSLLSILSGWFQQTIERFCLSDTFKEPQTFIKTSYSTGKRVLDEQVLGWNLSLYILCHKKLCIEHWCECLQFFFKKKKLKLWNFGSKQVHKDCQKRRLLFSQKQT